jgi:hypothetical protein
LDQAKAIYLQLGQRPDVQKAIAAEEAADRNRLESEEKEEANRIEDARRNAPGTVVVTRTATGTGGMYMVRIEVDGKAVGAIAGDECLKLRLRPGPHVIAVSGGGLSRSLRVAVPANDEVNLETYFSNWGVFGGGLNLREI